MSEDPVPYEPNPEEYTRGWDDGLGQGRRDTARVITEAARDPKSLRIEALQAAATVLAPLWSEITKAGLSSGTSYDDLQNVDKTVLHTADQFVRWLEDK